MILLSRALKSGIVLLIFAGCSRHPKDGALQASFQKNQAAFTNIVSELRKATDVERLEWKDGTLIVDQTKTNPAPLTAKLAPHLKGIADSLVIRRPAGWQIWFTYSSRGLVVSGSSKGILYSEKAPVRIVPDTDASSPTNAPFTVCSPLQTNWFIFYSR